jgi:hypothetical protein
VKIRRRITKGTRTGPKIAVQIYLPSELLRAAVIAAEREKGRGIPSSRNAIIEAALRSYLKLPAAVPSAIAA